MSIILKRGQFFVPNLIQCRHRGKIIIGKPKKGTIERRIFEAVTKPVVLESLVDPTKTCLKFYEDVELKEKVNPYEQFLVRKCRNLFATHTMVIIAQRLHFGLAEFQTIRNQLLRKQIDCAMFENTVISQAILETKWQNFLPLIVGESVILFSNEHRVKELFHNMKTLPQLHVLGGVVENRLLSRQGLLDCAQMAGLEVARSELVGILGSHASQTHSLLNEHQRALTSNLAQYVTDQHAKGNSGS